MNIAIKNLPKGQAEMIVELSKEDLLPYVRQAVGEISSEIVVPGFRSGRAPYSMLEKKVGAMKIYQRAAEKAVEKTYAAAIQERKLVTVGPPQITLEKVAPDNPLIYKAIVTLLPQVELADYRSIAVAKRAVTVTTEDVSGTLGSLRKMMGKEKRAARAAIKGDKLEIDMETFVDRVAIDGGSGKSHPVTIGEGHFIPGFEDALVGLSEGQRKEFQLKFPKEYHRKDLAGRPVEFRVLVKSVMEIELPELNVAFAKMVGNFEKLDDLRRQIEKNIHQEKSSKEHQRWELEIVDRIIAKSKIGELPDSLIEAELHKMVHELEHEVTERGMKYADYLSSIKKTEVELKREFRPQAVKRIQTALVLRTIADLEQIGVSDNEIKSEIENSKVRYQHDQEVLRQINSEQYREYLFNVMRSRKVFDFFEKNQAK